jgi:hypothetical protein
MARTSGEDNDCGVTTDPVVAIVAPEAVTNPAYPGAELPQEEQ